MAGTPLPVLPRRFGATMRRDAWWVQPAIVFLMLSAFIVYATWAAFQGEHYAYGPYLSPFYSPELFGSSPHAWFGPKPGWWPAWLPFSPALLILPFPGLFRAHLLLLPRRLLQGVLGRSARLHRRRAAEALPGRGVVPADPAEHPPLLPLRRAGLPGGAGCTTCGRRSGSPIRPPAGPRSASASARWCSRPTSCCSAGTRWAATRCATWSAATSTGSPGRPVRRLAYDCSSCLNRAHMRWAWCSLFSVAFADLYVRLCSMGIWTDWRIL